MPELPEVETVRNSLKEIILSKKIKDIVIRYDKIIENVTPDEFRSCLIGQEILDIKKKGNLPPYILYI